MSSDKPEARYRVHLCTKCHHPGGQHRMEHEGRPAHCVLCDCDGWDETKWVSGWWSDTQTDAAMVAR